MINFCISPWIFNGDYKKTNMEEIFLLFQYTLLSYLFFGNELYLKVNSSYQDNVQKSWRNSTNWSKLCSNSSKFCFVMFLITFCIKISVLSICWENVSFVFTAWRILLLAMASNNPLWRYKSYLTSPTLRAFWIVPLPLEQLLTAIILVLYFESNCIYCEEGRSLYKNHPYDQLFYETCYCFNFETET